MKDFFIQSTKSQREDRDKELDSRDDRGRSRDHVRGSSGFSSNSYPRKDDVLDRVKSSRWRTSPPPSARRLSDASDSTRSSSRRQRDSTPPRVARGSSFSRVARDLSPLGKRRDHTPSPPRRKSPLRMSPPIGKGKGKELDGADSGVGDWSAWGNSDSAWAQTSSAGADAAPKWGSPSQSTQKPKKSNLPPLPPSSPPPTFPSSSAPAPPVPTNSWSASSARKEMPKPTRKESDSPAFPSSSISTRSSSDSGLPSLREPIKTSPDFPSKLPNLAVSKLKPIAGPSGQKEGSPRAPSPSSSLGRKDGYLRVQASSPAPTNVSTSSSHKSLKCKRVRKFLTSFDYAIKNEVQRRTVSKKYERWKKIQESPQYSHIHLNGKLKLNDTRHQLKKKRDRLHDRVGKDIAELVEFLKPSPSPANANVEELINNVRRNIQDLNVFIADLKRIREEQQKADQEAKMREEKELAKTKERETAAAQAIRSPEILEDHREINLDDLRVQIEELEVRSHGIMDTQEENHARFLNPEFIEDALERDNQDEELIEDLENYVEETGKTLQSQAEEVGKIHNRLLHPNYSERKEKEEDLEQWQEKLAKLKEEMMTKLAIMTQAAADRREKINHLSSQIRNLHKRPKPTYSYARDLLPYVEPVIIRVVEEEIKPILAEIRNTTHLQVTERQKLMSQAIEQAIEPILRMTMDIVRRSDAAALRQHPTVAAAPSGSIQPSS
ncbi:hypothetical protein BDP27DRAFT_88019 [Rhodocollybia butyracea]|uniref:Uncharacterized protein n=1 Tax=Rhodocollybia butyracea TaxID=206335 RepID=A0A9P5Q4E9_9AGAR|nr:hypothetical protein BDP27DRAFT_88019 [Rhodocollybia butyracea]